MVFESFAIHFIWGSCLSTTLWCNYVYKFVVKPTVTCFVSSLIQLTVTLYKTYTTNVFVQVKYLFAIMARQSKLPSSAQRVHSVPAFHHLPMALCHPWHWKCSFLLVTHTIGTTKMPTRHHKFFYTASLSIHK